MEGLVGTSCCRHRLAACAVLAVLLCKVVVGAMRGRPVVEVCHAGKRLVVLAIGVRLVVDCSALLRFG